MKLTIERSKWLRNEGPETSYLIRQSDGKMCCLGFLGLACGLPKKALTNKRSPASTSDYWGDKVHDSLISPERNNTSLCTKIMSKNDYRALPEEREENLTALFLEAGVEVIFID